MNLPPQPPGPPPPGETAATGATGRAPNRGASAPTLDRSQSTGSLTGGGGAPSGFATSLNIDTLVAASAEAKQPDAATADKVHFLVNNLSAENMDDKVAEVKGVSLAELSAATCATAHAFFPKLG